MPLSFVNELQIDVLPWIITWSFWTSHGRCLPDQRHSGLGRLRGLVPTRRWKMRKNTAIFKGQMAMDKRCWRRNSTLPWVALLGSICLWAAHGGLGFSRCRWEALNQREVLWHAPRQGCWNSEVTQVVAGSICRSTWLHTSASCKDQIYVWKTSWYVHRSQSVSRVACFTIAYTDDPEITCCSKPQICRCGWFVQSRFCFPVFCLAPEMISNWLNFIQAGWQLRTLQTAPQ